jgi:hypothetical protein
MFFFWSVAALQIGDEIADALVYLDAGTLEAFQFIGAFPLLLELGARAICSLENASPLDAVRLLKSLAIKVN